MKSVSFEKTIPFLKLGKIGVIPTDTLYGLVASAMNPEAVERVYRVRGRDEGKPCIVLIADMSDLDRFGVEPGDPVSRCLEEWWPGKVSVVLSCPGERFAYLHRGTGAIAFRLPGDDALRSLLREAGPLIAPSANRQGELPATTVAEAEAYFGDDADFYVDGGALSGEPSTVVKFEDGKLTVIREGAVKISNQES